MPLVTAVEPNSGQSATLEIPTNEKGFFSALGSLDMPDGQVKRTIDNLDISADAKSYLYTLSKTTIVIGERIIKVGRKVLDYTCKLLSEFPNTAFGLVLGGVASALFTAIPGIGQLLGPFIAPILFFLGFLGGVFLDFKDKMVSQEIAAHVAKHNQRLSAQIDQKLAELHDPEVK